MNALPSIVFISSQDSLDRTQTAGSKLCSLCSELQAHVFLTTCLGYLHIPLLTSCSKVKSSGACPLVSGPGSHIWPHSCTAHSLGNLNSCLVSITPHGVVLVASIHGLLARKKGLVCVTLPGFVYSGDQEGRERGLLL